jgi:NAD(P)-dependent dehydrogenase (short-subunit alcohol dehydrogenase family)
MGNRLKDKVAIVTGAGRGIGRGEALSLASEGSKVVVNDLGGTSAGTGASTSPADEVVAEIKRMGGDAVANYDSVTDPKAGERMVKAAIDNFGRLDILVNNAGILRDKMLFNMTDEDWDLVMKVHLYGHFYTTRAASQIFKQQKRGGRIINTSSVAGLGLTFGQVNYGAAKEGIIGFTRQVAKDMARYGVTCNAIRPNAGTRLTLSEEIKEAWHKAGMDAFISQMEAAKPEDIGPLVVWLASDDAKIITGRTFCVQTGRIGLYSEPVEEKYLVAEDGWSIDELFKLMPSIIGGIAP